MLRQFQQKRGRARYDSVILVTNQAYEYTLTSQEDLLEINWNPDEILSILFISDTEEISLYPVTIFALQ